VTELPIKNKFLKELALILSWVKLKTHTRMNHNYCPLCTVIAIKAILWFFKPPYLTLPPGWTGSLHLPSAEAVSVWPNAHPRM